ncbi:EpsG family protein [Epilithonimonas arachidiradicis]|nr:EpsG family protein [Epilithonimonas arachidiradicis]RKE89007.1 EpsG-like putative glucosyltransferase [Epilithonimonas arachidiradicis]
MLAYSFLLFILIFGVFHFDYRGKTILKNLYYYFIFIYCILLTGLRYRVGGDTLAYEDYFPFYPDLRTYFSFLNGDNEYFGYQPLYLLFVAFCKSLNPDYYFYQIIHSIIYNSFFFWFIKKYSKYRFTTILISYIFLLYFYFGFEIQREIFAICCFLVAYKYFMENKWLPYFLICIVAFGFHISAIFLFILPLFKLIKFSTRFLIISIIISIPLLFSKIFFIDFIKVILVTDFMQKKGEAYSEMEFSILGILFFYFVRVIVFIPFLFYYSKNKLRDKNFDWMFVGLLWMSILSQVMVGFDRVSNYIYLPFIIFVTHVIYNKKEWVNTFFGKKAIISSLYLFIFSIIGVKLLVANIDNKYYYYSVYFPYESVLDKKETKARERFIREMWAN